MQSSPVFAAACRALLLILLQHGCIFTMVLGVTMIDGKWTILSKFIQGKTMSLLIKENPDNKSN